MAVHFLGGEALNLLARIRAAIQERLHLIGPLELKGGQDRSRKRYAYRGDSGSAKTASFGRTPVTPELDFILASWSEATLTSIKSGHCDFQIRPPMSATGPNHLPPNRQFDFHQSERCRNVRYKI
jgi:hypothetical protein